MTDDLILGNTQSVVHVCPPDGTGITPCCGHTPYDLPANDRITTLPDLVTCDIRPPSGPLTQATSAHG